MFISHLKGKKIPFIHCQLFLQVHNQSQTCWGAFPWENTAGGQQLFLCPARTEMFKRDAFIIITDLCKQVHKVTLCKWGKEQDLRSTRAPSPLEDWSSSWQITCYAFPERYFRQLQHWSRMSLWCTVLLLFVLTSFGHPYGNFISSLTIAYIVFTGSGLFLSGWYNTVLHSVSSAKCRMNCLHSS